MEKEVERGFNPEWFDATGAELEDFICSICHCVLIDAVQTDNGENILDGEPCGHLFCHGCISRWLHDHSTCPLCNAALSQRQIRPDANVRRKVRNLRVSCHIKPKLCSASGVLGKDGSWWQQHEEVCEFKIIQCPLCQRHRCTRQDMALHTREECVAALIWCRFRCEGLIPRWDQKNHEKTCAQRPMDCPQCQKRGFKQISLAEHIRNECPETLVLCPFAEMGCTMSYRRLEAEKLRGHMEASTSLHMELMALQIIQLKTELATLKGDPSMIYDGGPSALAKSSQQRSLSQHLAHDAGPSMDSLRKGLQNMEASLDLTLAHHGHMSTGNGMGRSSAAGGRMSGSVSPHNSGGGVLLGSPSRRSGGSRNSMSSSKSSASSCSNNSSTCSSNSSSCSSGSSSSPSCMNSSNSSTNGTASGGSSSSKGSSVKFSGMRNNHRMHIISNPSHATQSMAQKTGSGASVITSEARTGKETYQMFWSLVWQVPTKDVYSGTLLRAFGEDWGISFGDPDAGTDDVPVYLELRSSPKKAISVAMTISLLHPSSGIKLASKRCRHQFVKKTCWGFRSVSTVAKLQREGAFGPSLGIMHLLLQIEFSLVSSASVLSS